MHLYPHQMDRTRVIADFLGFARVCQELWLKGVLTQDVLARADVLVWSINGYKAVTADALLWSINDYPAFGTIVGRRALGYKACCHCHHKALSTTSNVEHINHKMVRRLQRELLFGMEVEEGSQLDAPGIVLQGLPPEENYDTPGDVSQFPDEVEELPCDS